MNDADATARAHAVRVRLTRKLARVLNGVDLSHVAPGEEILLGEREARLLVAEGWAAIVDTANDRTTVSDGDD